MKIGFVGCGVEVRGIGETGAGGRGKGQFDLGRDGDSEVALELQDIADVAIEICGPKVGLIAGLDELGGDADALAGAPYATFEQIIHTKFTSDLGDSLFWRLCIAWKRSGQSRQGVEDRVSRVG